MSLAAEKLSSVAFLDMLELIDAQPWLRTLHEEMVDLWNMCESRDEQNLLKKLLHSFFLFDAKREAEACKILAQKIHEWQLSPKSTWIVAVADNGEVDGSAAALQKLKNKVLPAEDWHARFVGSIPVAVSKIKENDTVVLFDDFIGSGAKMVKKKKWLSQKLAAAGILNVGYRFAAYSGMRFGLDHIRAETGDEIFSYAVLQKGISESYPEDEAKVMIELMLTLESRLGVKHKNKKIEDFSLGYGKSEALYCAENDNCPNNVFPIFWWPVLKTGDRKKTLFTRVG